jgi:hypothetical protein
MIPPRVVRGKTAPRSSALGPGDGPHSAREGIRTGPRRSGSLPSVASRAATGRAQIPCRLQSPRFRSGTCMRGRGFEPLDRRKTLADARAFRAPARSVPSLAGTLRERISSSKTETWLPTMIPPRMVRGKTAPRSSALGPGDGPRSAREGIRTPGPLRERILSPPPFPGLATLARVDVCRLSV